MTEREPGNTRRSLAASLRELLHHPAEVLRGERPEWGPSERMRILLGAVLCWSLYGLSAGFYQGGTQILVSAVKAPLILLLTLALCLPSLYVLTVLSSGGLGRGRFLSAVVGFAGLTGLLLAGLVPVSWLFSVTSRWLPFVTFLHVLIWFVVLALAARHLLRALPESRRTVALWLLLFFVVSLQAATFLRPVLWRPEGTPLILQEKMFFLEHFFDRLPTGHPSAEQIRPEE